MNKFFIVILAATIIIIIAGVFVVGGNPEPAAPPTGYEYFWGDGCPHCAKVAEFLDSWENYDKVELDKKEVWSNPTNQTLMNQRARECGISPSETGVPLLVKPDGSCVGGDDPIIEYFKGLEFKS